MLNSTVSWIRRIGRQASEGRDGREISRRAIYSANVGRSEFLLLFRRFDASEEDGS